MHPDRFSSFFFFPSAANNSEGWCTNRPVYYRQKNSGTLGLDYISSLYTAPHAYTHTFGFTINRQFPTKNQ